MKTLYLLRHAKSSRDDRGLQDHERPLAPAGRLQARAVALHMRDEGLIPELALVSSAVRTRETWELVAPVLRGDAAIEVDHRRTLYLADPGALLETVRSADDEVGRLLILGHNPGIATLARGLTGEGRREEIRRLYAGYPSAGLAELEFEVERWREVAAGEGALVRYVRPKDLPDAEERRS